MPKSVAKIALSSSRDIPFNRLVLSQANVRRVKAAVSIEELAEDIARRTLLQSLTVRPILDDEGAETGMFEIPAGGRHFQCPPAARRRWLLRFPAMTAIWKVPVDSARSTIISNASSTPQPSRMGHRVISPA